jgi:hypothetical protein
MIMRLFQEKMQRFPNGQRFLLSNRDLLAIIFSGRYQEPYPIDSLPIGVARVNVLVIVIEWCSFISNLMCATLQQYDAQIGLYNTRAGNDPLVNQQRFPERQAGWVAITRAGRVVQRKIQAFSLAISKERNTP